MKITFKVFWKFRGPGWQKEAELLEGHALHSMSCSPLIEHRHRTDALYCMSLQESYSSSGTYTRYSIQIFPQLKSCIRNAKPPNCLLPSGFIWMTHHVTGYGKGPHLEIITVVVLLRHICPKRFLWLPNSLIHLPGVEAFDWMYISNVCVCTPGAPDHSLEDAGFTPRGCPTSPILTAVRALPQAVPQQGKCFRESLWLSCICPITPAGGAGRVVCPPMYIGGKCPLAKLFHLDTYFLVRHRWVWCDMPLRGFQITKQITIGIKPT